MMAECGTEGELSQRRLDVKGQQNGELAGKRHIINQIYAKMYF